MSQTAGFFETSPGRYYINDPRKVAQSIPQNFYKVEFDGQVSQFYLNQIPALTLPEKVYNLETDFITRVNTFFEKSPKKSLGVVLNGMRGTGKSHTATSIALNTNLSIIVLNMPSKGAIEFIQSLPGDYVIFLDEFEKVFNNDTDQEAITALLSAMDGNLRPNGKRMWLLTTNNLHINENFTNRPTRIRYNKEFKALEDAVILEIIEDLVEDKSKHTELLDMFSNLDMLTFDIVKALLDEYNTFGYTSEELIKDFNVSKKSNDLIFNLYQTEKKDGVWQKGEFIYQDESQAYKYDKFFKEQTNRYLYNLFYGVDEEVENEPYKLVSRISNDTGLLSRRFYDTEKEEYNTAHFLITVSKKTFCWTSRPALVY
jgi:hypothetical protein